MQTVNGSQKKGKEACDKTLAFPGIKENEKLMYQTCRLKFSFCSSKFRKIYTLNNAKLTNNKSTKNVTCLKFLAFQMAISQKNVETPP